MYQLDKNNEDIPIQYREGKASFLDIEVAVDPRALIPRPETEMLVEIPSGVCVDKAWSTPFILEIGTGSGIIPIGIARKITGCRVISLDISEEALALADENIKAFGLSGRIELRRSDMFSSLEKDLEGAFDLIVSNPPYVSAKDFEKLDIWVKAEPEIALFSGEEGMAHLNVIAENASRFLKPGGMVAVEIGYDQSDKVKEIFRRGGLEKIEAHRDIDGHERVITGWKHG